MTTLTKHQTNRFRADYEGPETIIATARFDDSCGNGHNTFAITGEVYTATRQRGEPTIQHENGATLWLNSCGCVHEEIAERLPDLAPFLKWHLCSTDGPLHYIANTVYLASDRDHWSLRAGEFHQLVKNGLPLWEAESQQKVASETKPEPAGLNWKPYGRVGEGKARELDAARRSAIWPEATDEELLAPDLAERLRERLPALVAEFRAAVESLGFIW